MFQIGKEVHQGCILSPCLFNVYAEYIVRNAGLEEAQAGIKIAWGNINNLRYANDTTLMAESEELKSLLMKVKEESEKVGSKFNIQKLRSWHLVPSLLANRWGNSGNSGWLYFSGLQNHCRLQWFCDCSNEIKRQLLVGRKVMTNLDSILKSRDITLPAGSA